MSIPPQPGFTTPTPGATQPSTFCPPFGHTVLLNVLPLKVSFPVPRIAFSTVAFVPPRALMNVSASPGLEVPVRRSTRRNGGAQVDVDQKVIGTVGVAQGVHAVSHVDLVGICDGRAVATLGERVVATFQPVVVVLQGVVSDNVLTTGRTTHGLRYPRRCPYPPRYRTRFPATRSTVTPSDRSA